MRRLRKPLTDAFLDRDEADEESTSSSSDTLHTAAMTPNKASRNGPDSSSVLYKTKSAAEFTGECAIISYCSDNQ